MRSNEWVLTVLACLCRILCPNAYQPKKIVPGAQKNSLETTDSKEEMENDMLQLDLLDSESDIKCLYSG